MSEHDMEKIEPEDDVMTLAEFEQAVKDGMFIDYDGCGELATATHKDTGSLVKPSSFLADLESIKGKGATHIVWYNR